MIPKYRADIDGLRAIAVLSVLFYHAGSGIFSGGYVGVDIFFVISGYLITSIIVRDIATDGFSITRFYERRARRILPALAVVILAALVAGAVLLPPDHLKALGASAATAALFSSNILFFLTSGYFVSPDEVRPLLHTWSLAVEEQYYIFFPLLLLLIARFGARRYFKCLVGLGLLSFAACVVITPVDASATFYLIPARAWELFIGSVLSLQVLPLPQTRRVRETVAAVGAALIGFAVFRYTPQTSFPGVAAVLPTVGAAMIIHAGGSGQSLVSRVLSLRPVVFIGLISYSLYLWHWPLIVYTKLYLMRAPDNAETAGMVAASFVLAVLSWKYVETPFRTKRVLARTYPLLRAAAATVLVLFCGGLALVLADGLPQRDGSAGVASSTADPQWQHWEQCVKRLNSRGSVDDLCSLGTPAGTPSFVVWGDSHAMALASGISQSAARFGLNGKLATQFACPPLLGVDRPGHTSCAVFNRSVLAMLVRAPQVHTVILAARWALSAEGTRYAHESGKAVRLVDLEAADGLTESNVVVLEVGLTRTIEQLHRLGKRVVLVATIPEVGYDVPSAQFVARATGRDANAAVAPTIEEYRHRTRGVVAVFARIARHNVVVVVDPSRYLCAARCAVVRADQPMYRDDDHLSTFGSSYLAPAYSEVFAHLAQPERLASGSATVVAGVRL